MISCPRDRDRGPLHPYWTPDECYHSNQCCDCRHLSHTSGTSFMWNGVAVVLRQFHIGPHTHHAVFLLIFLERTQASLHEVELVPVSPVPVIRPRGSLCHSSYRRHTVDCYRVSILKRRFYHLLQCLFETWLHHWCCFDEKRLVSKCRHVFVDISQDVADPVPLVSLACVVQACRKGVLTSSGCHNIQKAWVLAFIGFTVRLLFLHLTRRCMESGGRRNLMFRRPRPSNLCWWRILARGPLLIGLILLLLRVESRHRLCLGEIREVAAWEQ